MAAQTERGIPLSALNPKFLHTNSTSHTWPFSAIAELVDNAYDPDVSAKQFWIDKTRILNVDCLTFMDNGSGLSYEKMFKMLSFGFSDKQAINGHVPVGLYGNGFKSGSMRLGKDAIVFSKTQHGMCVGMLSQSYLEQTKATNVVVPIVAYRHASSNAYGSTLRPDTKHLNCLKDILQYSIFHTEKDLQSELRAITSTSSMTTTGTRIIIWNLRQTSSGHSEFDFHNDRYDIRIPPYVLETNKEVYKKPERTMDDPPQSDYSLRAYLSVLYLNPRMQIIIRGQKVKTQLISKSLAYIRKDNYRPMFLPTGIRITFGYNTKSKEHYGIMMYHKNRLIKAYERVGCQLKANKKGVGVIGVIECNFLKPTHNKQDFDYTDEYRRTLSGVAGKLEHYWKEIQFKARSENPTCSIPVEDTLKRPDQNWAQCDKCLQWRKLPDGIDPDRLPSQWYCHMNPDPQFRNCSVPQEAEDSDDETPYEKTYIQHERQQRIEQEKRQQMQEDQKKKQEQLRLAKLERQNEQLRQQLSQQFKEARETTAVRVSVNPPPLRSALATAPHSSSARGQQAGSSPSSGGMPIITNVRSLSTPSRLKRKQDLSSLGAKKARSGSFPGTTASASAAGATSTTTSAASSPSTSRSSPAVVIDDDDVIIEMEDDDEEDDEIVIDETKSTPKPKNPPAANFDVAKVKTEGSAAEVTGMLMECSEDAALDPVGEEPATAATPACSPSTPGQQGQGEGHQGQQVSITTQTETGAAIKEEAEPTVVATNAEQKTSTEDEAAARMDEEGGGSGGKDGGGGEVATSAGVDETAAAAAAAAEEEKEEEMEVQSPGQGCSVEPMPEKRGKASCKKADNEDLEVDVMNSPATEDATTNPSPDSQRETGAGASAAPSTSSTLTQALRPASSRHPLDSELLMEEAQAQQDQLMEMMEKTAKERDKYQTEVHQLIVKVEDLETQLAQTKVKKEQSHQHCQTDQSGDDKKDLQEELEKLQKERDALLEEKRRWVERRTCGEGSSSSSGEKGAEKANVVDDELALQVDFLLRQMDEGSTERDILKAKLNSLEMEKEALASRTERLQEELEEIKKAKSGPPPPPVPAAAASASTAASVGKSSAVDSSQGVGSASGSPPGSQQQPPPSSSAAEQRQNSPVSDGKKEGPTPQEDNSGTKKDSCSDQPAKEEKLNELRRSVGRLLVTFVPALDLDQVNYDCNVIDEILDQVLEEITQNDNGVNST
ncbi:MORC family CW-type zinc finger protein 3a [Engraulis encrasicolus]|uniref:MORC family CW-type zinc finger protein 3a n=1 Tax=Engraulis encrasicolus TaxID=184585 RepID=UPI002FD01F9A